MSDQDAVQKAAQDALEKRRYERVKAGLQIKYRGVSPTEEATLVKQGGYGTPEAFQPSTPAMSDFNKVLSEDISAGGFKISTPAPLPEGTRLWVQLSLPGVPMAVNAIAQVRWTRRAGSLCSSGLKFESISQGDLQKVENYLVLQKKAAP